MTTNEGDEAYDRAQQHYRACLERYSEALKARDASASLRFEEATAASKALRMFGGEEAKVDEDMHLVLAFSLAVEADDAREAERVYGSMSETWRETADGLEALEPGSMKIWLRR